MLERIPTSPTKPQEFAAPRNAWVVVFIAVLGFVTSLTIHIIAYYQFIDMEFFLLYCRLEWVGAALVGLLLGLLMPSTTPRQQLRMLFRWMITACSALVVYAVFCGWLYYSTPHPRKLPERYVIQHHGEIVREVGQKEYQKMIRSEHRLYVMYLNRAFSIVWVILFFGVSLYGIGYLRELRQLRASSLSPEKYVPWWYGG